MSSGGYEREGKTESRTLTESFRSLRQKYQSRVTIVLVIIAIVVYSLEEISPSVEEYVVKSGLLEYIILIILLDIGYFIYRFEKPATMNVAHNQDETMPKLIEVVPLCRSTGIDLLEYAGFTTLPLIRAVQREGVHMRMLVKHPDTVDKIQAQRTITTLDTIYNSIFCKQPIRFLRNSLLSSALFSSGSSLR